MIWKLHWTDSTLLHKIPTGPVGKNPNLWEILAKDNINVLDGKVKNADPKYYDSPFLMFLAAEMEKKSSEKSTMSQVHTFVATDNC